jgi:gliding motility-associated-like protein
MQGLLHVRTNTLMTKLLSTVLVILIGVYAQDAYGQFNFFAPQITGQRPTPLVTEKNTPIVVSFSNLRVTDADLFAPAYPQGYSLKLFPGSDYAVVNATVTPSNNFVGVLTVQAQVNDGKFDSNIFDLKISVTNIQPVITDQEAISIKEAENFTLLLSHLMVKDDDNTYPDDFTLSVFDGSNYSVTGNSIKPDGGFSGKLKVSVSVNDGHENSKKFDVTIEVQNNVRPDIKGQVALSVNQGKKLSIEFNNLTVNDPDDKYPAGFTLKLFDESNNYSINGVEVIPSASFAGKLTVPVSVNDGIDESNKYNLIIDVIEKINVRPDIVGQDALSTNEDKSITVTLSNLKVVDPDNDYPADFKLKLLNGLNYTVTGAVVKPNANYSGPLEVSTTVTDGEEYSEPFPLQIAVQPTNDAPVVTGQNPISIPANTATVLKITSLEVQDPDGQTIANFTVKILPGTNYTFAGATLTPAANFTGTLTVRVVVNDGFIDSAPFNLKVEVLPKSIIPLITGQQPLFVDEDASITLKLTDLTVADEDNPNYPSGFIMKVFDGPNYTFENLTITPSSNYNNFLTVYVRVFDGKNWSDPPYPLKIYVIPANDAPQITQLEEVALSYIPGNGAVALTEIFECIDIDDPAGGYLSFAELKFDSTFKRQNDILIFNNTDTAEIRGVYESGRGVLSLIGYASLDEYKKAIRSIKYNYQLTEDESGNQSEVVPGLKYIHLTISDGQAESETRVRVIKIESSVSLDIPNAFTPNNDAFNKTWKIRSQGEANRYDKAVVKVYNKRGLLVYESKGLDKGWDGSFNGEALPVDTYYYTIDLNLSYVQKTFKGVVMILR